MSCCWLLLLLAAGALLCCGSRAPCMLAARRCLGARRFSASAASRPASWRWGLWFVACPPAPRFWGEAVEEQSAATTFNVMRVRGKIMFCDCCAWNPYA